MEPVVVFITRSDIEASVVSALLSSRGIDSFRVSGNPQAIWPMVVQPLGSIQIAVPAPMAEEARQLIDSHREQDGSRVVRLRDEFESLQERIGYRFRDRGLLEHALTHRSRAAEDPSGGMTDNESLEFLGDAVLGFVVAAALYHRHPDADEGVKSKIKASLVSSSSLARLAESIGLGDYLLLGRGEEKTGGRRKPALLADAFEAVIAAIYLDGGIEAARAFLEQMLAAGLDAGAAEAVMGRDFKSALQERLQALGRALPEYRVAAESGPGHRKVFTVEVCVDGEVLASASGLAKKQAEQEAARQALVALNQSR